MGNNCTAQSTIKSHDDTIKEVFDRDLYVLTTMDGLMLDINDAFESRLHYSIKDIKGRFIGTLMNSLISYLHKKVFIKRLGAATGLDESRLLYKLHSKTAKRPFIIYDLNGKPVYASINLVKAGYSELSDDYVKFGMKTPFDKLELKNDNYLIVKITMLLDIKGVDELDSFTSFNKYNIQAESNFFYGVSNDVSSNFKQTRNDVVVICIDILPAEKPGSETSDEMIIMMNQQFYNDVIDVIKRSFYPFIYIYEIVGDSYMFTINSDWTYNISQFCGVISIYFIKSLLKRVEHYVSIRAGISFGKISYGLIGGNLRLFGDNINLSARLEHECERNEILISQSLYLKLESEITMIHSFNKSTSFDYDGSIQTSQSAVSDHIFDIHEDVERCTKYLKGLGNVDCFRIKPDMVSNIFQFLDV